MNAVDEHGRPEPGRSASEADTLLGFIDFLRATIEWKCQGLDDEQLRTSVAASSMTLGGLLTHLAYVEDWWCTKVVGELSMPQPWASVDWRADPDWDWHLAATRTGEAVRAFWNERVAASQAIVAARLSADPSALERTYQVHGDDRVSLRWVLTHLIEEYARHCGHADLIREAIDGTVGE